MSKPQNYTYVCRAVAEIVDEYRDGAKFLASIENVPRWKVLLFSASYCEVEVMNGGFFQFFQNPTGVLAPETLQGFVEMNLKECAELLEAAMLLFGEEYPRDQSQRVSFLDARTSDEDYYLGKEYIFQNKELAKLEELSDTFSECVFNDEFDVAAANYLKMHGEERDTGRAG